MEEAQHLLETFCSQIEVLYGENFNNKNYYCEITLLGKRYRSANIHILLHFADSVRHLGLLWAHSALPFEDSNGWLRDLFRGSRDPSKQVSLNHTITIKLILCMSTIDSKAVYYTTEIEVDYQLIIKTTTNKVKALMKRVEEIDLREASLEKPCANG